MDTILFIVICLIGGSIFLVWGFTEWGGDPTLGRTPTILAGVMIIIVGIILAAYISTSERISKVILMASLIIIVGIIVIIVGLDLISEPSWWVQQYGNLILSIGVVITVLGVIGGIYVYIRFRREQ